MSPITRWLPWFVVGMAVVYFLLVMLPPAEPAAQMHFEEFASLPIVDGGRVKPMDTLARNSLMVISSRQTFRDEADKEQPAVKWLLDVMTSNQLFNNDAALNHKVFRIENDQVLSLLGLPPRPGSWRYALGEFEGGVEKLMQRAAAASDLDPSRQSVFDVKVIELAKHIKLYVGLSRMQTETLRMVPPVGPHEEWASFYTSLRQARDNKLDDPAVRSLGKILLAYAAGETKTFNREVADYHQWLGHKLPETDKVDFEVFFNHFSPFLHCAYLYVAVFLLTCVSWMAFQKPLNRAAFWLTVLILLVHTWALLSRMYIQGRPPVTNLYSSAVFIGWCCVLLGIILEVLYRNGVGNIVAAVTGSLSMLIAHHLASGGDTMEMMQAVLDTNFWLATHVTCVTFGYAATFIAGFLGLAYITTGVFTRKLDRTLAKTLGQMIYGVVCFATLLSFTGTVLGGIWADQSWGRFWGWDPKENGALLIVLMNALILHARWGGMVQARGMAVLAIVGNMVTGWSWFGTNQLGVGLHAYGFNNTLAIGLRDFWGTQLLYIALGLLPLRYWRSFAVLNQVSPVAERKPRVSLGKPAVVPAG